MKRIISLVLSVIMVVSSTLFVVDAATEINPSIRISDTTGADGYAAAMDEINEKINSNGGVTVVMDVLVEEYRTPAEEMFSQIVAFTGGGDSAKYNLLSYNFTENAFKAGQSMEWVTDGQADYAAIATNAFEWECGRWYELAFRFNGTKAAMYLNGICVISTEFDAAQTDYLIVYPQFCDARFDNIRICAKDYNVAEGTGTVWATEDFDDLSSPADSAVWYAETYEMSDLGCNGVITSSTDDCIRLNDTDGTSGYIAAFDEYNEMVAANNGGTIVADIYVESFTEAPAGMFSQIVAFSGAYDNEARYNYTGYDFGKGAFTAKESGAWISDSQTDMYTEVGAESYALECGVWYEFAWQFNGNKVTMYLDGEEVLTADFNVVNNSYLILFPQFCNILIDNIRICDKDFDAAKGVGTIYAVEDFTDLASADTSDVVYCDPSYAMSNAGPAASNVGDANGDGNVNSSDVVVMRRKISGASVSVASGADINVDGLINTADITLLTRIIAGYAYRVDYSINVNPIFPDNSAIVEDDGGDIPDVPVTPPETSSSVTETEPPVSSTDTIPEEPDTNETFIDGLDGSTLRFDGKTASSYTFLLREGGIDAADVALSFDALISEIDDTQDFAGLGVWNGNNFAGYDFKDQCIVYDTISYPYGPATNNGNKLGLKVGEWNHFTFRRINNNTFHVYVNGVKQLEITGKNFENTFFLFGFKNCTAYVDNYQFYDAGEGKGLIGNFATFTNDGSMLKSSDGGNWLIGAQGFGCICTNVVAGKKVATGIAGTPAAAGDVILPDDPTTAPVSTATPYDPSAPVAGGSGNTAGLDESALKFSTFTNASYSLLFSDKPQSWADMALTFDVKIESVDAAADFAGLGVWSGNNDTGAHQFTGFDFNSKQFASGELWYPTTPADNNGPKMNLQVGEWNHFCFRRLNNDTFEVYVNGTLCYTVTNQKFENTYFLFGFKGVVAYVDNYQYYHSGTACGLVDDFTTGAGTKDGMTMFSDGGYWLVGSQSFDGVVPEKVTTATTTETTTETTKVTTKETTTKTEPPVTEAPTTTATPYDPSAPVENGSGDTSANDKSVLKFDTLNGASYSLLFSDKPQSYTDMALTFDVKIESVNSADGFAGLGVWSGNVDRNVSQFTGFNFVTKQFTSDSNTFYPSAPKADLGPKMNLQVGEWNHFCFRRLNNNTFEVYVNGKLCYTVTDQNFADTYYIFAFKNVVAYVDNYQYYHGGIACGLVTDFKTGASTDADGYMRFSDGGYWIVHTSSDLGFGGVIEPVVTTVTTEPPVTEPAVDTAVEDVIAKISSIGTVTYKSLSAITAAESAYAGLTNAQKKKVTNYSTLTSARSTYDALHAEVVTYKNTVAALPATPAATEACRIAIANCAVAYATLTSPGQVDAVKTEKAKYDAFRAAWEKAVADAETPADVDRGNGSGDTSGIDGSALKFTASGTVSYSLLFSEHPQSYTDMALTFDVKIESIDSGVDFAGLGVWSGNGDDNRSSFTGYDFVDKRFTSDNNTFFPSAPTADSNVKMNLQVGEWNHFCFRRLNNNTFQIYVNGKLCYETTGYNYANTYFIFAFKNCTAYVDNYQYYHAGTPCGLVTDFTTGASTDAAGETRFSDGGYWVVGSLSYAGVVKGQPGFDSSVLKFDGNAATSYTLVLNEGPISNTDVALSFDVYIESIDSSKAFAGLGVWNGDNTFIGYDFKDQKFTAQKGLGYPYPPDNDNGGSLKLNVGEWNHFVFRRLNNNSMVVYVNGVKGAEITGLSFTNTYMIFGFKYCVAYIDNYQAYENGVGKGLYTDFSKFTNNGNLVSPDGGYWIVGTQGFAGIQTTGKGGVTGSGIAGTNRVPGSNAIDGVGRINLDSGSSGGSTEPSTPSNPTTPPNLQKILNNIQSSGNIPAAKKAACTVVATELYNLGYETAFIAGVLGNLCHEGNTGIFEYYNTNTNYHPNFNSYLQTYYGTTYKAMFSGKYIYNMNLTTVYNIFTDLNNRGWSYNGVRIGTGVGCIQWTFGRSYTLIKIYREVTGNGSSITKEQALAAEGLMVSRELNGSYKSVYTTWKKNNAANLNSQDAAYNAAYDVCTKYERPSNMYESGKTRGNFARLVYADLIK